jgi:tetratricopeptide (TPR) repeat protein
MRDLPEYREAAKDACLHVGMMPRRAEELVAQDRDPVRACLELVDQADVYVGIYAWRYGTIVEPHGTSITELEYDRAVQRGIPILAFIMKDGAHVTRDMVEATEAAQAKLEAFKAKVAQTRLVQWFDSPEDLRSHVMEALREQLKRWGNTQPQGANELPWNIPARPVPYVAHPYPLLDAKDVVGRREELALLDRWIGAPDHEDEPVFLLTAVGGMGKSALCWKWFHQPERLPPRFDGRVWCSFYESGANVHEFTVRLLSYTSGRSVEEARALGSRARVDALLTSLNERPFLVVLDGLESTLDSHRRSRDVEWSRFLQGLGAIRGSHVLASTRVVPTELQRSPSLANRVRQHVLAGLEDEDALVLWAAANGRSEMPELLSLFHSFGNHPLFIQLLAREVANFEPAGDFRAWWAKNSGFGLGRTAAEVREAVLERVVSKLSKDERHVLLIVAAFPMPMNGTTLNTVCASGKDSDRVLSGLTSRGLLGWAKQANRYDLHPVVRAFVWEKFDRSERSKVVDLLRKHLQDRPRLQSLEGVSKLEDLHQAFALFEILLEQKAFDEAFLIFQAHIHEASHYLFGNSRKRIELLQRLFPDGPDASPAVTGAAAQATVISWLAKAYQLLGEPRRAQGLYRRSMSLWTDQTQNEGHATREWSNLSGALRLTGQLLEAESAALHAIKFARLESEPRREAVCLYRLGLIRAVRGDAEGSKRVLDKALSYYESCDDAQFIGVVKQHLSRRLLWLGQPLLAAELAKEASELARERGFKHDVIRATQLQGEIGVELSKLEGAEPHLDAALRHLEEAWIDASEIASAEEELSTLRVLAEVALIRKEHPRARELLARIWKRAELGPYPLIEAEARCVLARLEKESGNRQGAIESALCAHERARCDGPPYTYAYALAQAERILEELGASVAPVIPCSRERLSQVPVIEGT